MDSKRKKRSGSDIGFDADGPTVIHLDDQNYEIIDIITLDEHNYVALAPYSEDLTADDNDELTFTLLEVLDDPEDEKGCILKTIEDDDLYDRIGEAFIEKYDSESDDDEDYDSAEPEEHEFYKNKRV